MFYTHDRGPSWWQKLYHVGGAQTAGLYFGLKKYKYGSDEIGQFSTEVVLYTYEYATSILILIYLLHKVCF